MNITRRTLAGVAITLVAGASAFSAPMAMADDRGQLIDDATRALHRLEATEPQSRFFEHHAAGVLIFPHVLKAGFIFGGESGNGVLFVDGRPAGIYNLSGGSWGLQVGGQDFSYALFFMTPGSMRYLHQTAGFDLGTGPSIVVINAGAAAEANITTITHDVYAFPYNERGLMADLTLQGTKITRVHMD